MAYILQVDFKMEGPFGDEMAAQFKKLAESICNRQPKLNIFCSLRMNTFYSLNILC